MRPRRTRSPLPASHHLFRLQRRRDRPLLRLPRRRRGARLLLHGRGVRDGQERRGRGVHGGHAPGAGHEVHRARRHGGSARDLRPHHRRHHLHRDQPQGQAILPLRRVRAPLLRTRLRPRGARRRHGHRHRRRRRSQKFQAMALAQAKKVPVAAIEFYLDMRNTIENHVTGFTEPTSDKLLPDLLPQERGVFTLVLDLDETLVYSDWQRDRGWRTFKRPGVEAFVQHMAQFYEVVVYSDQQQMYVDPVIDRLDTKGCIMYRLSRPATKYQGGKHYRDLSKLNRNPEQVLYISAHALESCLQLENCVSVKPWKLETDDTQLLDLIPFLEYLASARPTDVRPVLASFQGQDIATEFAKRAKGVGRQMQERKSIWRR